MNSSTSLSLDAPRALAAAPMYFAVDAPSGHLYATSDVSKKRLRVGTGETALHIDDNTALPTATAVVLGGSLGVVY